MATYSGPNGEPRCARCEMVLPLAMVAEPVPPQKQSAFKITLETNRQPPALGARSYSTSRDDDDDDP